MTSTFSVTIPSGTEILHLQLLFLKLSMTASFPLWLLNSESSSSILSWQQLHLKLRVAQWMTLRVAYHLSLEVTQSSIVVISPWPKSCTTPTGTGDNSISNTRIFIPSPSESHIVSASFNESCLFYTYFFLLLEQVSRHSLLPFVGRILWTQIRFCVVIYNMLDLVGQYWKSPLTSLLVSRQKPYPNPSDWLPPLSLKQGNLLKRFHVS